MRYQVLENASEKLARMMTATGVKVVFDPRVSGPMADVQSGVILMPQLPDKLTATEMEYLHGALDHEAAHLLFTRSEKTNEPISKSEGFIGVIENALEDGRINRLMGERFLGSKDNLRDLYKASQIKLAEVAKKKKAEKPDPKRDEAIAALTAALKVSVRHVWKRPDVEPFIGTEGDAVVATLPDDLRLELEAIETIEDVKAAAPKVAEWLKAARDEQRQQESQGEGGDEGQPEKGQDAEGQDGDGEGEGQGQGEEKIGANSMDGFDDDEGQDEGQGEGAEGADGDENSEGEAEAEGEGDEGAEGQQNGTSPTLESSAETKTVESAKVGGKREVVQGAETGSTVSDTAEFEKSVVNLDAEMQDAIKAALPTIGDADYGSKGPYAVDRSHDKEVSINALYAEFAKEHGESSAAKFCERGARHIFADYKAAVGPLRARLVMDLQSNGKVWTKDLRTGRLLDTGSLARPSVGDSRVFKHKRRKDAIETTVTLLVDCSGSMSGSKIESALQLAALFTDALEMANVPCEVLGFTTGYWGSYPTKGKRHEPVLHLRLKERGERLQAVRDKWPLIMHTLGSNVDGEAVEWAAKRLVKQKEQRKILLVLSDGFPAASMSDDLLNRHLKETVANVSRAGIEVVGIGIQSKAVERFYPRHVVYNRLEDLMSGVYKGISDLLRTGQLGIAR